MEREKGEDVAVKTEDFVCLEVVKGKGGEEA